MTGSALLEIKNLTKHFPAKKGLLATGRAVVRAVDNVSFSVKKGETFGLVGESGSGKTTVGKTIIRLYEPTAGEIYFDGRNITKVKMRPYRKRLQMIFQDPYTALDPRMTVSDLIGEALDIHGLEKDGGRKERIYKLLDMVGLGREHSSRYPHEFSGGQRQRIGIARALAVEPECIICDEPVSALDVSIQAQIVNMLEELKASLGLTYIFITHDLSMVRHISDRTGVMYLGKLVELADSRELHETPLHPYTKALLSAIPVADPVESRKRKRIILEGDVPGPMDLPSGCRFRARCSCAMKICGEQEPEFMEAAPGHFCACHLIRETCL